MSSPFRNTNNLLSVQGEEQDHHQQSMRDERRLLREEREAIRTDFNGEIARNQSQRGTVATGNLRSAVINLLSSTDNKGEGTGEVGGELSMDHQLVFQDALKELQNRDKLDVCVEIYSLILNLNMTTSILSELTFLLTIINMEIVPQSLLMLAGGGGGLGGKARQLSVGEREETDKEVVPAQKTTLMAFEVLFRTPLNCIYLAVEVLSKQRGKLLALLDAKTLRILIENEKLAALNGGLITYLQDVYRLKGDLELRYCTEFSGSIAASHHHNGQSGGGGGGQQNVFYQADEDTRDNFPTQIEFGAFKKQRDLFYVILRMWEERHLHANWNFNQELGGRIRYLFVVMAHPINMAHLARLFTSQLVVCCQNWNNVEQSAAQAELLQRFDNVDLTKLSKLEQRFVQPGNFSAELQFPGIQVFFKEFIVAAESSAAFVEQLKIALMAELIALNDSTYEIVNVVVPAIKGNEFNEIVVSRICVQFNYFIPRPGLNSNGHSLPLFSPAVQVGPETMSIMRVLAKFLGFVVAMPFQYEGNQNKLVDNKQVELRNLQLPQFDVATVLETAMKRNKLLITLPWLVEYLAMLDAVTLQLDYYRKLLRTFYRIYVAELPSPGPSLLRSPMTTFILRLCLGWLFEQPHVTASLCALNLQGMRRDGEGGFSASSSSEEENRVDDKMIATLLHPVLEKILPVACPFLADFRLTIVPPRKQADKLVSRTTGRYRHIVTTKLPFANHPEAVKSVQKLVADAEAVPNNQSRLIEAFLQSQSPSLRKVVDFLIERISSTTIKDFQIQHFLEIKKDAQKKAKQVDGRLTKKAVVNLLVGIYTSALVELTNRWTSTVPEKVEKKVKESLEALLPVETIGAVRKTCSDIVIKMCTGKTNDWRIANLNQIGEILSF